MRILVTGGAGFIGANLCRVLTSTPGIEEVVALDNLSMGRAGNLDGLAVELIEGDVADPATIERTVAGVDTIVHLAALGSVPRSIDDPLATHLNNATGTLQLLEGARRAGNVHTIVASSSSVYGATTDLPKHEALPTRPMSPYGVSKLATEWYSLAYQHSMGLPVLAFRFFNVFGPLQPADHVYAAAIPRFVDAALSGRPVTVYGDGLQSRDFTYVDTVCETIARAVLERTTSDTPVNLAFGEPWRILDVISLIGEEVGRAVEIEHAEPRPGDIRHSDANSAALRRLFPDIQPTQFQVGLKATIDWFRQQVDQVD